MTIAGRLRSSPWPSGCHIGVGCLVLQASPIEESSMTVRFDPVVAAPELMKTWFGAAVPIGASLETTLAELIKMRASQINGCANCINLHAHFARKNGETEQRLYLLPAWREAPCYTDRERAALGWTEALTRLTDVDTRDSAYAEAKLHFTEEELVKLTLTIVVINGWNRIAVASGGFADPATVRVEAEAATP